MYNMQYHFTFFIKMNFKTDAINKIYLYLVCQFMLSKWIQLPIGNDMVLG